MTRILKSDRIYIADRAALLAVADLDNQLSNVQMDLAEKFYKKWLNEHTSVADRKVLPELSPTFVSVESSNQRFGFDIKYIDPDNGSERSYRRNHYFVLRNPLRFPANLESWRLTLSIKKGSKDHESISEYERLESARDKKFTEIKDQVDAFLTGHTTVKKAIAAWPELEGIFPERLTKVSPKVYLPAFNPTKLNQAIGLPRKEAA